MPTKNFNLIRIRKIVAFPLSISTTKITIPCFLFQVLKCLVKKHKIIYNPKKRKSHETQETQHSIKLLKQNKSCDTNLVNIYIINIVHTLLFNPVSWCGAVTEKWLPSHSTSPNPSPLHQT